MFNLGLGYAVVAVMAAASVNAEPHCPGNVPGIPYHLDHQQQMVVEVSIDHAGPYSFLLDTGAQMTIVDPSVADALHLAVHDGARVVNVGTSAGASFSQLELLEAGQHTATDMTILVYDLRNLQVTGLNIEGVLGEDFLDQFDVLVDNAHRLLCLDDTGAMRQEVKGEHIPLLAPATAPDGGLPIVSVWLSDGMRPVRLALDSGANVSFLYGASEYIALRGFRGAPLQGGGATGVRRNFLSLPPQDVKIGPLELPQVEFVTVLGARKDSCESDFDGMLATGLFRRVFINYQEQFAILDPM